MGRNGVAKAEIRGPTRRLFFGNVARFRNNPLNFLSFCREVGNPLVRVDDNVYLVIDPDLVEAVFHDKDNRFVKSLPANRSLQMVSFPASVMNSSGEDWYRKRQFLQPAFHRRQVDRRVTETFAVAERHLDQWRSNPGPCDIRRRLQPLCLDAGCQYLLGTRFNEDERSLIIALADAIIHKTRDQKRFRLWPFDRTEARLAAARKGARGVIDTILARTRSSSEDDDWLSKVTEGQDEPSDWLHDEFAAMILSGLEPMADALAWTLYLLAGHSGTLDRVVAEIDGANKADLMSAAGLAGMAQTRAAVKEALRLFPPAWLTGRIVAKDTQLGGFDLPEGAALMISPWVNHRDARHFDTPDQYVADRWLDGTLERRLPRYAFFPFGGGARRCIGEHFAMINMVAILTCLLGRFALREVQGNDVRPFPALVLRPLGIRMILTPRADIAGAKRRCS